MGKRINEEELNFKRAGWGEKVVETIAEDLEMSAVHIWKCVQFYKKFELKEWDDVAEKLPKGKAVTWFSICQDVLPKGQTEKEREAKTKEKQGSCGHNRFKCLECGAQFFLEELLKMDKRI